MATRITSQFPYSHPRGVRNGATNEHQCKLELESHKLWGEGDQDRPLVSQERKWSQDGQEAGAALDRQSVALIEKTFCTAPPLERFLP